MTAQEIQGALDRIAGLERAARNDLAHKRRLVSEEERRFARTMDSVAFRLEMLAARVEVAA